MGALSWCPNAALTIDAAGHFVLSGATVAPISVVNVRTTTTATTAAARVRSASDRMPSSSPDSPTRPAPNENAASISPWKAGGRAGWLGGSSALDVGVRKHDVPNGG